MSKGLTHSLLPAQEQDGLASGWPAAAEGLLFPSFHGRQLFSRSTAPVS